MTQKYLSHSLRGIYICLVLILLIGCQAAPVKPVKEAVDEDSSFLFYPPLPNSPRIQYLTTFSSSKDFEENSEMSGVARFILGDEIDSDIQSIEKPYGVAYSEGRIYVVDTRGNGYGIFDLQNKRFELVGGTGGGAMNKPINITIDTDGTKYITDTNREQILVFSRDDKYLKAYGTEGYYKPVDIVIDGDRLFVSDIAHHRIMLLDKETGKELSSFGGPGNAEGELFHPTNLAIGPDNHLYISDTGNYRVSEFTLEGEFVEILGGQGLRHGQLARPKGVAIDRDGNLYVVDAAFQNVQIFNQEGQVLMSFGGPAANHPSGMSLPTDIVINYEGVAFLQQYADPKFLLEYVILVPNQFGRNKVNVFGYGRMEGMSYPEDEQ